MSNKRFMQIVYMYRWITLAVLITYAALYLIAHTFSDDFNPLIFHSISYRLVASVISLAFVFLTLSRYLETRQ